MNNFSVIYKILKALERSMDCTEFNRGLISPGVLDISAERRDALLEMLQDAGYIKGVIVKDCGYTHTVEITNNLRITIKGLEYLSENSFMRRAADLAMGIGNMI